MPVWAAAGHGTDSECLSQAGPLGGGSQRGWLVGLHCCHQDFLRGGDTSQSQSLTQDVCRCYGKHPSAHCSVPSAWGGSCHRWAGADLSISVLEALGRAPLHLGVKIAPKNPAVTRHRGWSEVKVQQEPRGGPDLQEHRGSVTGRCPSRCSARPRLWPQCRCRGRAGRFPGGAAVAVGKPPSVHTVLAGAEVFHLPQFLLIKRMNYISVAGSALSPVVLCTPGELCVSVRSFMRCLSGGCWCRRMAPGGLGCAPHLSHWAHPNRCLSPGPAAAPSCPWSGSADG